MASREQWVPKGLAVNRNIAPSVSQIVDDFFEGLDPGAATKAAASGVKHAVSGQLRRSDKPPEQSGGLAPMERLMYVMDVMHDHAISHAQTDDFPDCLEKMDPEGVYQKRFWKDVEAVQGVAAEKQGRGVQVPKKKIEWRTFLERSAYDATQLRRMISAMLTSKEACGTSRTLVDLRPKFLRFFDIPTLPDPTELGYNVLEASGFEKNTMTACVATTSTSLRNTTARSLQSTATILQEKTTAKLLHTRRFPRCTTCSFTATTTWTKNV